MQKTVLLLSGTCEGRVLARALCEAGFRVHATVTRPETVAKFFVNPQMANAATVEARGFTEDSLAAFLNDRDIAGVLDGTHPFAVRITRMSHAVCGQLGKPYVRYERPDWEPPADTVFVDSFAQAADVLPGLGQRVMLTIGCKQLKHFVPLQDRLLMYARILPAEVSLAQALQVGFRREQLVCLRPPVSLEANRDSLRELGIEVLVTKASGREGGVVEKVQAARELGVRVVMIRRPVLADIPTVGSVADAVRLCVETMA